MFTFQVVKGFIAAVFAPMVYGGKRKAPKPGEVVSYGFQKFAHGQMVASAPTVFA